MKNLLWVMRTTLRAALWRSTAAERSVSVFTVLVFATLAMASEAARQYLTADSPPAFSIYGVNSIVATMAVFVAVTLLFVSQDRATVLARLACLIVLLEWTVIAASRLPFEFRSLVPEMWTASDKVIFVWLIVMVWWIGAVVAILRGAGVGPYQSPVFRAFWLSVVAGAAVMALPAYPTFIGGDFRLSSYNVWEWGRAKFSKSSDVELPPVDVAAVELSQPHLLEAQLKKLLPERKGTTDIYAIGIAGWSAQDVFICLTRNQTVSFRASDFDPGVTGYIVAVVVNESTGRPAAFNCLIGDAFVKFASGQAINYGAVAVSSLVPNPAGVDPLASSATLKFDGIHYNRLPRILAAGGIPSASDGNSTLLTLMADAGFKAAVEELGGYSTAETGRVVRGTAAG